MGKRGSRKEGNAVSTGKSVGTAFFLGGKARAMEMNTIYSNINRYTTKYCIVNKHFA